MGMNKRYYSDTVTLNCYRGTVGLQRKTPQHEVDKTVLKAVIVRLSVGHLAEHCLTLLTERGQGRRGRDTVRLFQARAAATDTPGRKVDGT